MTDNGSERTGGGDGGGPAVLAAFEDPEPLTAAEVAAATGTDEDDAERALEAQVSAGRLGEKAVGGVRVWYPTPGGGNGTVEAGADTEGWDRDQVTVHGGGDVDDGADFDETRVEAAVAELDVPGTSEMMRDWRRSAVRGAFDHVRTEGDAVSEDVIEAVFPAHSAGYTDEEAWWACVAPRLAELPGIDREGDTWEFVGGE